MKFIAPVLFAIPAVMGRACKIRHSHSSTVATVVSTAEAAITTAVAVQSSVAAEPETESAVQEEQTTVISVAEPQTTLATAVIVSSSSSSSSAAAASSSAASDDSSTGDLSTEEVSGSSTFYGGNLSGGNCMFTTYTLPSSIYGTAFSGEIWDNAAHCGACIEVTGPSGTITAMIVDQCPECDEGHLDLFPDAFTAVGGTDGVVDTSYKFVKCGITSPLILHNKTGTSAYWFSIQVVNANVPVASLEVSTDGGSTWQSTTRQDYNFFEESAGFGVETVDVRVTSTTGETITVSNVGVTPDAQYTATSNF
ncbi:RlpA-like double-psi beta-barrel-protein domain-containing protein-containing protein [Dactylonectria macrodidyma]|uniref:RlpA-like double-psi beta-barrel-protein domain-containing protein-containing protein n=1 Tax=Dactylonectria macrodidyma TaxID=307937 RepID=A0A9P9J6I8_9HYPO|nr:RlpA-like double-psi beta-barrel-protein domain-containing protein-containing protein [Dactylonectria macrodidyma]